MHIRQINPSDKHDRSKWIRFPFHLYRNSRLWVPPLISSEEAILDRDKHPFYKHSTAQFHVAEANGKVVGRIALLHNRRYCQAIGKEVGFFGFFEVVEDIDVARALLETCIAWGKANGFKSLSGPKGLIGSDASGILVEGFEHHPALNVPYNYPYYDDFIKDAGFVKERDSLSGYISAEEALPDRIVRIADVVKKRRGITVPTFKSKDELRAAAPLVIEAHRAAFGQAYAAYPHTDEEYAMVTGDLITIAEPELIKIAMKGDTAIGFVFAYPDISEGLRKAKGKLYPLGWYYLLRERSRTKWVNVNGLGVIPEYQGMGVNAVLYAEVTKAIKARGFEHVDTVLIGEENFESFSDNVSIGVTWYKRHRLYRLDL
jgi:GNAT superfamily N-acetyltransferase